MFLDTFKLNSPEWILAHPELLFLSKDFNYISAFSMQEPLFPGIRQDKSIAVAIVPSRYFGLCYLCPGSTPEAD